MIASVKKLAFAVFAALAQARLREMLHKWRLIGRSGTANKPAVKHFRVV